MSIEESGEVQVQSGAERADGSYSVDMIRSAKDAQWSVDFLGAQQVVKVISPSKVNLFLSVGNVREDGYHDAVNVMHTLALHDTLYFGVKEFSEDGAEVAGSEGNIAVRIDIADKTISPYDEPLEVATKDNLVFKAIDALAREVGFVERQSIEVRIEKNVPVQAGLAGGSANAAAALVACAKLWGISAEGKSLDRVAQRLGADIAFFLEGGCCEYVGRGEQFSRRLDAMKLPVVIVKPDVGVSTAYAYEVLDKNPHPATAGLLAQVENATSAQDVALFNSFDEIAGELDEELLAVKRWLEAQGGICIREGKALCMLSGSGAATFAIAESFSDATRIVSDAKARGFWARATTFCSLKCAVV